MPWYIAVGVGGPHCSLDTVTFEDQNSSDLITLILSKTEKMNFLLKKATAFKPMVIVKSLISDYAIWFSLSKGN